MTEKASAIVLDASVALAWCFPDEVSEYADAVLAALAGQTVLVPAVWSMEIANALLAGERHKRITGPELRRYIELLKGLSLVEDAKPFGDILSAILPLAREYRLSAYDAAYLDLAIRNSASIATLDKALQRASRSAGVDHFRV